MRATGQLIRLSCSSIWHRLRRDTGWPGTVGLATARRRLSWSGILTVWSQRMRAWSNLPARSPISGSSIAWNGRRRWTCEPGSVELVTVAIAVHWFDLERFYAAVRRVVAPEGVLAVWTYHLPEIDPAVDPLIERYYGEVLAGYWPAPIQYIEDRYRTLPFPFKELEPPEMAMQADWPLDHLAGFLSSWSASQRYQAERGEHPLRPDLARNCRKPGVCPTGPRRVRWPLHLRVGRVQG